jgi:hypothetical protein
MPSTPWTRSSQSPKVLVFGSAVALSSSANDSKLASLQAPLPKAIIPAFYLRSRRRFWRPSDPWVTCCPQFLGRDFGTGTGSRGESRTLLPETDHLTPFVKAINGPNTTLFAPVNGAWNSAVRGIFSRLERVAGIDIDLQDAETAAAILKYHLYNQCEWSNRSGERPKPGWRTVTSDL